MEPIKTVGIKNLKNELSRYLQDVRRGWRVLITDRDQVVAELREPLVGEAGIIENPLYVDWVRKGKIRSPLKPKGVCPRSFLSSPRGTALNLLDRDRAE